MVIAGRGGDSGAADPGSAVVVATPSATPVPPTPTPSPASAIPAALQERLNALPGKLRTETIAAYAGGSFGLAQLEDIVDDYENRNPNLRVGSVLSVSDAGLRIEVYTTGERREIGVRDDTLITRSGTTIDLADLRLNELVMVVTSDDGASAVTVEAFGVAAP